MRETFGKLHKVNSKLPRGHGFKSDHDELLSVQMIMSLGEELETLA